MENKILVVVGLDGRIEYTYQDGVFRRSNKQNELVALLLFPNASTVKVNFLRSDGVKPKSQYMTYAGEQEYEGVMYNAYSYALTDYQLYATGPLVVSLDIVSGNITATSGDFTIDVEASESQNDDVAPSDTNQFDNAINSLMSTDRTLLDRTKNVPNLVAKIQKVAFNAFTYTNNSGVVSAPIVLTGGEEAPMPVTPASTITISKDANGWQPIYESDQTTITGYKYEMDAALHGQMRDDAKAKDLWVSFSAQDSTVFDGKYADYSVDAEGNITVTVSEPVDLTIRVWNGKGLVDNVAREQIAAETSRAETEEASLQEQITELQNSGVDTEARASIVAETQRAEAAESSLSDRITANASDIVGLNSDVAGLREDINNESHFRGMFNTVEELRTAYPTATPNDYAWIAGGNIWTYGESGWTDTGKPVPSTAVPASTSTPLMDGVASVGAENSYARGDHRHPRDNYLYSPSNPPPIDSALSTASANPVQNMVITNALNNKMDNASAATSFNSLNLGINTLRTSVVISTCSTSASVANKIVSLPVNSNLSMVDGLVLRVKFTNANTASNPKLSFGGILKSIYSKTNGTLYIKWRAGDIIEFSYDLTNDRFIITGGYILESMPVGTIYLFDFDTSPINLFGGSWSKIDSGLYLGTATNSVENASVSSSNYLPYRKNTRQSLPNIQGSFYAAGYESSVGTGAFSASSVGNLTLGTSGGSVLKQVSFNARYSNGVYGAESISDIKPRSYGLFAWRRTA